MPQANASSNREGAPGGKEPLKKNLGALDVYAIATGATLSAGFFLLPGLAAQKAGPALILSYLLAVVPLVPAMFSMVELMTAMPRAGGIYYFLDRSLGPVLGTIGGIGTWLVLILKVSFALVGMGAYLALFFADLPVVPVAVGLAAAVGLLNIYGAKLTGSFQIILLVGLLSILAVFIGGGLLDLDPAHFQNFLAAGGGHIFATAGLVYVSYVGLTKVASISEEVEDPERNLPLGTFAALGTAVVVYGLGTTVIVGALPIEQLSGDMASVATAAGALFGPWGRVLLAVAALLAFTAVANAGTFSASRYPLSMSRDYVLPPFLQQISKQGLPARAIVLTVGVLMAVIVFLNPLKIAKLASVFQLFVFSLVCLAVIVMRESEIDSYDPGFRSPLYPWMQIFGLVAPLVLIAEMGWQSVLFSLGLVIVTTAWYFAYARGKTPRAGAIYHLFERLGRQRHEGLNEELREIIKEKGLREDDPFGETVARAQVIDYPERIGFEEIVREAAERLSEPLEAIPEALGKTFLEETQLGVTPVSHGAALLHLRLRRLEAPQLLLVRAREGVDVAVGHLGETTEEEEEPARVHALFFLVSPEAHPRQHLRLLAELAGRIEDAEFRKEWLSAHGEQQLKEVLLRDERFLHLRLEPEAPTAALIGRALHAAALPDDVLVALINRNGQPVTPRGPTVLEAGDRLTMIGTPEGLTRLREEYANG